jgi:uncharacterized membrane protein
MKRFGPLQLSFEPLRVGLALVVLNVAVLFPEPFRAAVVLPLALVVPGRALVLATLVERQVEDRFQRLALETVCSAASYPLLVLVFALFSVPVRPLAVLVGTDALVVTLLVVASRRLPREETETEELRPAAARFERRWGAVFVAAVFLAFSGVAVTRAALPEAGDSGSVSFSLAHASAQVSGVQVVPPGSKAAVTVRVENMTTEARTYRLAAKIRGHSWPTSMLRVPARSSWEGTVSGEVPPTSCPERLSLALVPVGRDEPVRTLTVYFRTSAQEASECRA